MFSKRAEAGTQSWSLARRLSLLIGWSSFALLAGAGLFLYWNLADSLEQQIVRTLEDKLNTVRTVVRDRFDDKAAVGDELHIERSTRRFSRNFVRILNADAQTLIETPGMTTLTPPDQFAEPATRRVDARGFARRAVLDHRTFALIAAVAPTRDGSEWQIQLARDISIEERMLASYRSTLILTLALGLVLAALAGRIIARKGLAPFAGIMRAVRETNAAQLDVRVTSATWPVELHSLAAAFDDMLDRLQHSFQRVSQFSADIAHELRTPVTNLLAATQVTLAKARPLEEYQRLVESSTEELANLARIIDALLFLARAEQARCPFERERLDARKEVENVIEFHRASAEESQVALCCEGHGLVFADSTLLQRAISNLLSNAVRHTPRRGSVRVEIAAAGEDTTITVRDTGQGIPPEHLPHLFDRFYRVDPSRAHASGGFGLGLAIVKSIVTLHQGDVSIASTPGAGTTVTLRIPLRGS